MSERRMFSKSITESDAFLEMDFSSQSLYFHMVMNADDEGFVNSSRRVSGMIGATSDDLKKLVDKGFLIYFDSGIYVIKHWKINNRIRVDRKRSTNYQEEKSMLTEKSNGVYSLRSTVEDQKENEKVVDCDQEDENEKLNYTEESEVDIEEVVEKQEVKKEVVEVAQASKKEVIEYDIQSEPRKNYAEQVFDILFAHDLPCCNGNLITFTMRDFRLASQALSNLHLHSDEVIEAVKNYAKVIDLKRQGQTWWSSEQTFYNFCEKNTILKFLPENFKLEDFYKQKDGNNVFLDDKIQL